MGQDEGDKNLYPRSRSIPAIAKGGTEKYKTKEKKAGQKRRGPKNDPQSGFGDVGGDFSEERGSSEKGEGAGKKRDSSRRRSEGSFQGEIYNLPPGAEVGAKDPVREERGWRGGTPIRRKKEHLSKKGKLGVSRSTQEQLVWEGTMLELTTTCDRGKSA